MLDPSANEAPASPRTSQLFVGVFFLLVVVSSLIVQTAVELSRGQSPGALEVFRQKPTAANLRAYEHTLEDASLIARTLRPLFQFIQTVWLRDGGEKALLGRDGWLFYKPGYTDMLAPPGGPTMDDAVTAIVSWRDALAARGIHLLVVPVPNKEGVYPDFITGRVGAGRSLVAPTTQELLKRLRAARVDYLDLFELYARLRSRATTADPALYLKQDSHWSPAGVDAAATAVAQRLLENNWVSRGTVEYQAVPVQTNRVGDLLRMLQAPLIERCSTPEAITCARVVRRDNAQPYHDDAESEVLVLGDSFLRVYQQDEPGSAGLIAHLAMELRRPLTSIVNDGGASTLVRQELYRRPALLKNKRVVIWEFVERDIRLGMEGWQQVPLP